MFNTTNQPTKELKYPDMSQPEKRMYVCKASAGTGKTYTLAAHYIALLMNNVPSKNILAVTFTNKATEEMKQRIITHLNAMAYHSHLADTQCFMNKVYEVAQQRGGLEGIPIEEYPNRAQTILQQCMSDFDDLSICTIDSFLQTLLTGLAQAIGQAAGFGVDLDVKHAITTAVDEILSLDITTGKNIKATIVQCLNERLFSETKWDLRPGLIKLAENLFKENVQEIQNNIPFDSTIITNYKKELNSYHNSKNYLDLQQLYQSVKGYVEDGTLSPSSVFGRFIKNVGHSLDGGWTDNEEEKKYAFPILSSDPLTKQEDKTKKYLGEYRWVVTNFKDNLPLGRAIRDQLLTMLELSAQLHPLYWRQKITGEYLNDLLLAGYVIDRIRRDQRENNTFLLSQTAYTLIQALDKHDARFILMKAGIRYHHIMLDEFQDTSSLQWQNFRLLLEEILSTIGGTALIVGDVKQSIYRWRNGDYEIMNGLDQPQPDSQLHRYYQPQQLICNRRSRKEIVQFNLETFQKIRNLKSSVIAELTDMYDEGYDQNRLEDYYVKSKTGGYVCLRQFTGGQSSEENEQAKEELLQFMFDQMEKLLELGYDRKDMLILIRSAAEAKRVLKTFREIKDDVEHYPHLHLAGKIISNDSFLLESSIAVNTIISALKWKFRHDEIAKTYITINHPQADIAAITRLDADLPFTDIVEQIIRICLCDNNGNYSETDVAFINCLQDKIRGYIATYGSNVNDFLRYWDDKMHVESIPATDSNDIRIMTIHSSKGLQAKNVFIPFCAWKEEVDASKKEILWCPMPYLEQHHPDKSYLPVTYRGDMQTIPELQAIHEEEQRKQYIDSLNLLYVACTRAEDNLFILVNKNNYTGKTAGSWLVKLYEEEKYWGEMTKPQVKEQTAQMPEPFSFDLSDEDKKKNTVNATYNSSVGSICFRQSNQTRQLMHQTKHIEDNSDNIAFGNLCHAILGKVQTAQDVERVVHEFFLRGAIPTPKEEQQMIALLNRLITHPTAGAWFDGSYQLLREDTILSYQYNEKQHKEEVTECRMDRVMIRDNRVIVLDYKFGKPQSEYTVQVQNYMRTMMQMGYTNVRGYLWYGFQGQLQEVTL